VGAAVPPELEPPLDELLVVPPLELLLELVLVPPLELLLVLPPPLLLVDPPPLLLELVVPPLLELLLVVPPELLPLLPLLPELELLLVLPPPEDPLLLVSLVPLAPSVELWVGEGTFVVVPPYGPPRGSSAPPQPTIIDAPATVIAIAAQADKRRMVRSFSYPAAHEVPRCLAARERKQGKKLALSPYANFCVRTVAPSAAAR
jgi:hypothetical protein